ncbi:MAG: flagellar hook-basal body complex protein FliE [Nevskia sp.]|jgi:flagellar hook-basal body complex protein FliE|nr:flagellar hook-basal body complex protein FliE [Nevskia sp.]MCK9383350.1 flagellar hook-basal body complex protein FliE [Nevskia sp.]
MIDPISRVGDIAALSPPVGLAGGAAATRNFSESLGGLIGEVNGQVIAADQEVRKLAVGEADSLHHVLISVEEAKVSLGLIVQVRNRLVDAYQELLRMQI